MRIGLFVDGSNMYAAQRERGWHIDWQKVYDYFAQAGQITECYYVSASPHYSEPHKIQGWRRFKAALTHMGYTVIDKEIKRLKDSRTGTIIGKGNLDIELAITIIASMQNFDQAVIFSGDGDFVPVVKKLRANGKTVVCVALKESTSLELVNHSSKFINLDEISAEIEKK